MRFKFYLITLLTFFLIFSVSASFGAEFVVSANATSTGKNAGTIKSIFNEKGSFWSPDCRDSGVDEGFYLRFKKSFRIDYLELDVESNRNKVGFQLYLNGKTTVKNGVIDSFPKNKNTVVFGAMGKSPMGTVASSMFLKIQRNRSGEMVKVTSVRIYRKKGTGIEKIDLVFPGTIQSSITATSILNPVTAYSPSNLFDSNYTSAWSTDGAKTSGIGESISISLKEKANIKGFVIWNGYQRSKTHFVKNGSVKKIEIRSGGVSEKINLNPTMGARKIILKTPLKDVKNLKFTILDVKKGTRYRDVLISELRLIDESDNLVNLEVKKPDLIIPKKWDILVDRSFSPVFHATDGCGLLCINKRIRLRNDGTFVIYKNFDYSKGSGEDVTAEVYEGNWEVKKGSIRIFGKRYTTSLKSSEYMGTTKKVPSAIIFQSFLTIKPYNEMSSKDKKSVVNFLTKKLTHKSGKNLIIGNVLKDESMIMAESKSELDRKLESILKRYNPIYIKSSVFTDYILPTDELIDCFTDCP